MAGSQAWQTGAIDGSIDAFIHQPSDRSVDRPKHGGHLAWAATIAGCSPTEILDFSASINPLGLPESARVAVQAAIADLGAYPDPSYRALRQALADHHGVDPEWILPGNGAAELLTWAARDLAALAATLLPVPAFGDYGRALAAFGAKVVPVRLPVATWLDRSPSAGSEPEQDPGRSPQWALDRLDRSLAQLFPESAEFGPADRLGLILNNPHNPTGLVWPKSDLLPLVDRFGLVVLDEAFMDFLPADRDQSLVDQVVRSPQVVVIRSLTKFYAMPGLRLGYAIAHPDRLARWQAWRDPWSVNSLAVAAALAALADHEFQARTWAWLSEARSHLISGLRGIPDLDVLPGAVNFVLVRLGDRAWPAQRLQRVLLERDRLLIRDCGSFDQPFGPVFGETGDRFIRLAVRTRAENQRLLIALKAVLRSSS